MIPNVMKRPDIAKFNWLLDKCVEYSCNILDGDFQVFLPTMMLFEWCDPAEQMSGLPGMRLIVSCFQNFTAEAAPKQCFALGLIFGQRGTQLAAAFLCAEGKIEVTNQMRKLMFAGAADAPSLTDAIIVQGITVDKWTNGAMIHTPVVDGKLVHGEILSDPYGPDSERHMAEDDHYLQHFLRGFGQGLAQLSAKVN